MEHGSLMFDAVTLSTALELVSTQCDTVDLSPCPEGWKVSAMTVNGVTMSVVTIPSSVLEGTVPEPFAVDAADWRKALKGMGKVTLTVNGGRAEVSSGRVRVALRTMIVEKVPRVPTFEADAMAVMKATELSPVSRLTDRRTEEWRISVQDGVMEVTALDDQAYGASVALEPSVCQGSATSRYPHASWTAFLSSLPSDAVLSIEMCTDYPARVEVSSDSVPWTAVWLVAPRIVEE